MSREAFEKWFDAPENRGKTLSLFEAWQAALAEMQKEMAYPDLMDALGNALADRKEFKQQLIERDAVIEQMRDALVLCRRWIESGEDEEFSLVIDKINAHKTRHPESEQLYNKDFEALVIKTESVLSSPPSEALAKHDAEVAARALGSTYVYPSMNFAALQQN